MSCSFLGRSFLKKPDLGRYVNRIICKYSYVGSCQDMSNFTQDDYEICEKILVAAGLPHSGIIRTWMEEVKIGNWDSLMAVLLCQTSKIELYAVLDRGSLNLTIYLPQVFAVAKMSQSRASSSSLSLSNLLSVFSARCTRIRRGGGGA